MIETENEAPAVIRTLLQISNESHADFCFCISLSRGHWVLVLKKLIKQINPNTLLFTTHLIVIF